MIFIQRMFFLFALYYMVSADAQMVLNRGNGPEPDSLNIHLAEGLGSHHILRDLYEGLITLNALGQPIPGVAKSYSNSEDGLTWRFTLDPESKWSDGKPVSSYDFVFAWNKAIDARTAAPFASFFDNLMAANIKRELNIWAEKDHTLVVVLQQPDPAFLEKLTLPVFMPLPKHRDDQSAAGGNLISNGAYVLAERINNEKVRLKQNPHYLHQDDVFFEQVIYWVTEEQSSELKRFRAGELDVTETIPDNHIQWLQENMPEALRIHPYQGVFFLGLNIKNPPLDNLLFRQALSLAIDRQILVEKVLKSGQIPALQLVPPGMYDGRTQEKGSHKAQVNEAKRLLELSHVNHADLDIELLYNSSENQRKVALAVAAMWRQNLGVRVRLRNQEWKVFVSSRKSPERHIFRSGWIADYADPLSFLELFSSESRFNFYRFNDAEYDALIDEARFHMDKGQRSEMLNKAETMLKKNMPVIPLYFYVSRHLVSKDIGGYQNNPSDRHLSRYLFRK